MTRIFYPMRNFKKKSYDKIIITRVQWKRSFLVSSRLFFSLFRKPYLIFTANGPSRRVFVKGLVAKGALLVLRSARII